MKFKEFIDKLLFYISVPKCVSCGERLLITHKSLCEKCKAEYDELMLSDCSICAKPLSKCSCSNSYLKKHYIHKVIKVFRYDSGRESAANKLIYNLKRENRDDVIDFLSDELYKSFQNSEIKLENTVITNVPRRNKSIRKYGYDHSKLLAKALAKKLGVEFVSLLVSHAKSDQKQKRGREERVKNAEFDYRRKTTDISGKNVIILDDIITTGASMSAAAMLIHGLGAKKIIGAALAIAYKDDYTPPLYVPYNK